VRPLNVGGCLDKAGEIAGRRSPVAIRF
jgi:hypothetical protein